MSNLNVNTITPLAGTTGTVNVSGSLHVSGNISANGNLTIGNEATDTISMSAELTSSIVPDVNLAFDLGSGTKRWKNVFAGTASFGTLSGSVDLVAGSHISGSGTLTIQSASISYLTGSSNIIVATTQQPDANNTHDLGTSTRQFKDLYIDGKAYIDTLTNDTVNIEASASIIPSLHHASQTTQLNLGSTTRDWSYLYAQTASLAGINASGSGGNVVISGSLIPDNTGTRKKLGSEIKKWNAFLHTASIGMISGSITIQSESVFTVTSASISHILAQSPITFSGSLIADANNAHDLGSTSIHWQVGNITTVKTNTLFAADSKNGGNIISSSASLVPITDDAYDLGSSTIEWRNLFIDGTANVDILDTTFISASTGTNAVTHSGHIIPGVDDLYDLGSPTLQFRNLYADGIAYADTASVGLLTIEADGRVAEISSSLIPAITNRYHLGSATLPWKGLSVGAVTASILHSSGSNTFGAELSHTHTFAGHITSSGDISSSRNIIAKGIGGATGTGSFGFVSSSAIWSTGGVSASGNITTGGNIKTFGISILGNAATDTHTFTGHITSSNNIAVSGAVLTLGNTDFGNAATDTHTFTGHITSSNNIAVSGSVIVLGNTDLGNASTDTHTFTGGITASNGVSASALLSTTTVTAVGEISGSHLSASSGVTAVGTSSFHSLPQSEPQISGALWLSGSGAGSASGSRYLMVYGG